MMETISKQNRPLLCLKVHSYTQKMNQWPDPTITFIIVKVLKAIPKTKNADMRLPITSTVLYKIVSALKHTVSTRYEQILLSAMLTLAYHALMRVGEMTVNNNKHEHVLQVRLRLTLVT